MRETRYGFTLNKFNKQFKNYCLDTDLLETNLKSANQLATPSTWFHIRLLYFYNAASQYGLVYMDESQVRSYNLKKFKQRIDGETNTTKRAMQYYIIVIVGAVTKTKLLAIQFSTLILIANSSCIFVGWLFMNRSMLEK